MMIAWASVRLFQRAMLVWVIGFIASAYFGIDALNTMGSSPLYAPPGPLKFITHALAMVPDGLNDLLVLLVVPILVLLCLRDLLRAPRWWSSLLIWFLYANLMDRAWLAGSGGQQLIANLLFWNIFLSLRFVGGGNGHMAAWSHGHMSPLPHEPMATCAFWIIRVQLLLAYFATGLHKLTGTSWLDGTAMGIVASDPAFGPLWIVDHPLIASITTWAVLAFQLTFPIAVWFRRTRYGWMLLGILFHLATALWMDIPEMGLAFIAAYPIWFDDQDVHRFALLRRLAGVARSRSLT